MFICLLLCIQAVLLGPTVQATDGRGRLNCAITTKLNYAMAMFLTATFTWS